MLFCCHLSTFSHSLRQRLSRQKLLKFCILSLSPSLSLSLANFSPLEAWMGSTLGIVQENISSRTTSSSCSTISVHVEVKIAPALYASSEHRKRDRDIKTPSHSHHLTVRLLLALARKWKTRSLQSCTWSSSCIIHSLLQSHFHKTRLTEFIPPFYSFAKFVLQNLVHRFTLPLNSPCAK